MKLRWTILSGLAAMVLIGCVERQWTIRSEPAGAIAYVSNVEVGRTPVTIDFTWYGDYELILRKEGYETLKTNIKLDPPWYEIPPADFFSEIAPWTYEDHRETLHILKKPTPPDKKELIDRAEKLRQETLRGE
jgi:hypothetical protein